MEINNINLTDPMRNKGDITNEVNPSVLIDAPCASSILSLGETSCLSGTVSVEDEWIKKNFTERHLDCHIFL